MHLFMSIPARIHTFLLDTYISGTQLLDHRLCNYSGLVDTAYIVFQSSCTNLQTHLLCTQFQFTLYSYQHLVLF